MQGAGTVIACAARRHSFIRDWLLLPLYTNTCNAQRWHYSRQKGGFATQFASASVATGESATAASMPASRFILTDPLLLPLIYSLLACL